MGELLLVALAGFMAAMVDGALGMGFGPTSSTILLSTGLSPASVSTTVNITKVASGLAAGVSHWRFKNIDHRLVLQLAIPGAIGALIGVTVLTNVDGNTLRPYLAAMLVLVGLRMLLRFSKPLPVATSDADPVAAGPEEGDAPAPVSAPAEPDGENVSASDAVGTGKPPRFDERGLKVVAVTGGITNGLIGAWGPIVTPFLLHRGLSPRFAIGSVNTAEVAVAGVAATSLVVSLGRGDLRLSIILAMMVGGVAAAPLAAWVIRYVPARAMGLAVGGLLLTTNVRDLSDWAKLDVTRWAFYGLVVVLVAVAALAPRIKARSVERRAPALDS